MRRLPLLLLLLTAAAPSPIAVTVAHVTRADVPILLSGLGTVAPFNTVTVRARVDGELTRIAFADGQHVHAGQLLAEIDRRPLEAQRAQAEAAQQRDQALLDNARLDLQRVSGLAGKQYTSRQSVDTQKALVAQYQGTVLADRAQADYARVQLGYATITSPLDGVAGIRLIDQGNIVHAADATGIVTISQIQPISVLFSIAEDDLPALRAAMATGPLAVTVLDRAGTTQLGTGQLAAVDNQIDQGSAMVRLKAVFPNTESALWPGQFVLARVRLQTRRGAVVVPSGALRPGPDGPVAFVVGADGRARLRHPVAGASSGDLTIIASGLEPGETVVTEGQYKLEDGTQVDPAPPT